MPKKPKTMIGSNSMNADDLKNIVDRLERKIEDKRAVGEDINDIMKEADAKGFDKKVIREVIKLRAMEKEDLIYREELRTLYMKALDLDDIL
jgi:uncharacterized protein (UPF0335 family)